ncbi:MAG: excinuclease ABC subunit UvrB [bacterium]|nr:excinuclease ABC subunit UvrB [bacterium]
MAQFKLVSKYQPRGDQPEAIKRLVEGVQAGDKYQTLLGVTGSGKTFTMANVIEKINKPTLIMSHNKTLAAQLYGEFKAYFPDNAVEFFISYYDYYQPEAYVPSTDTYIEKDTSVNDNIDRLRLRATSSLLERDDTIIVASVSCIYGIGSPSEYKNLMVMLKTGEEVDRNDVLRKLIEIQYTRNDIDFSRGHFRVRGDTIEIFPAYEVSGVRIEMWGDTIERIRTFDPVSGEIKDEINRIAIYPARHFVSASDTVKRAIVGIEAELRERLAFMRENGKLLEAQRLESRTLYDLEMLREIGYCSGIENYSRYFSGRASGERPYTLIDFFPEDFLLIVDESHQSIPQVKAMYADDRSRKEVLVEHGFRLPSAMDNRPLIYDEFVTMIPQTIYCSATPADLELANSGGVIVEQIIRPTGLVDPTITIRPVQGQIDDFIKEIRIRVEKHERILVTTLTKRMAEDLSDYLARLNIRVRYLHSEVAAIERTEILRDLRLAEFDVLVGINLLREGLDLPEVSLVAILDADKEGFLRSARSLMQTAGRAARNVEGEVILYADKMTDSMKSMIGETNRRRKKQLQYNEDNGITPETIFKTREEILQATSFADSRVAESVAPMLPDYWDEMPAQDKISFLSQQMEHAAAELEFERAAELRDQIMQIKDVTKKKARR